MYIISEHTSFDPDHLLYETYIGLSDAKMTLICSAWGPTEKQSRLNAERIRKLLELNTKTS